MPVVIASGAFDQTAQKTVEIPQLPFFDKLFQSSVVVQRPIPMVVFGPEMLVHHGRYGPQGIFAPFFHVVHMPVVCNDRCLWCLRQCRRSSRTCCPCPCCVTTRAHGARDSAGAVHSSICGAHRDDLRRQTACSAAPWCCESACVAMSCGGGFTPGGAYDSICDSGKPMTGYCFFNYFQYQDFVGWYAC